MNNNGSIEYKTNEKLRRLLNDLKHRLSVEEYDTIEQMIWAGEPTVAIEWLAGTLLDWGERVSRSSFDELVDLGTGLNADPSFRAGILVIDDHVQDGTA